MNRPTLNVYKLDLKNVNTSTYYGHLRKRT